MEKPRLIGNLWIERRKNGKTRSRGIYECPLCGKHFECMSNSINTQNTVSCGCAKRQGPMKGLSNTKIACVWYSMMLRCYDPKCPAYEKYGGDTDRKIYVCDEWKNDFMVFREWALTHGYMEDLEINRINNDGPYTPENCAFDPILTNQQNKRLLQRNNTTGCRGVQYVKITNKWNVTVYINKERHYLGTFKTKEEAASAYNECVKKHKSHHPLNIIH